MVINPEVETTVEEYLKALYRPDCELVDGMLHERIWGELNHSRMHAALCGWSSR
jgi:hypothetical protein